jgi:hypothetical protein
MLDEGSGSTAYYEQATSSLLARTPARIPDREWSPSEDWHDFRAYLESRLLQMRNWRTPWWLHWAELAANILPRRYHFLITPNQMTRGLPINQDVVDSTPTQAVGVCAAGMMDGMSSPTKLWFRFKPKDDRFKPDTQGQRWLDDFQARVYDVMNGSNYYDCKHQMYEDEIVFGTGPMIIYEHRDHIINCQNPCAGEYYCATAADNSIGSFYREFTKTNLQIVEEFGPKAVQNTEVATGWTNKELETEQLVAHAIEPNFPASRYGQNTKLGVVPGGYAYREVYWLRGKSTPQPLSVRGFHEKPLMCPRWNTRSNDPYGRSPGMDALPDVRQLHQMTRRLAEAIDKMVRPPMLADVGLKNEPSSILPGRVTYVANLGKDSGMRPTYTVEPKVGEMMELIKQIQSRVERWFFNDVFLMISQMEGVQPRNELELNERRGEKLLRLGPVIERNLREDAAGITRIVSIMARRGLIPPKPESLRGIPVEIDFVSKLALIQKAAQTGSMERVLAMAGKMEAALPGTLDNINPDKFIRDYGEKLDFPSNDWQDDEVMAQIRQNRSAAEQNAQMERQAKEVTPAVTQAAKNLSDVDTGGGMNAIQALLGGGGAAGASQPRNP